MGLQSETKTEPDRRLLPLLIPSLVLTCLERWLTLAMEAQSESEAESEERSDLI